jgi:hypothetical protein
MPDDKDVEVTSGDALGGCGLVAIVAVVVLWLVGHFVHF